MNKIRRNWILGWLSIALLLGGKVVLRAVAQSDDAIWPTPVNISQSGSAVQPVTAVDAQGTIHVFWQDPAAGFAYSNGDGRTWLDPVPLRVPFTEPFFFQPGDEDFERFYTPRFVIDANDLIHAFWIGDGNLLYSRAPLATVTDRTSWTFPVALAEAASALDVLLGEDGRIHLSYIRPRQTNEFPAGVYYNSSGSGGTEWAVASLIYPSQYLAVPTEAAHIQIAASGETVLVAWDNRPLDSVFVAQSPDSGASWGAPFLADSRTPNDDLETVGPSSIDIGIVGNDVHITWHAEHTAGRCIQYHQWSDNRGETWQPEPLAAGNAFLDCPTTGQLVLADDGLLFLMTHFGGQTFLQAWGGAQWSKPVVQGPLAGFVHPHTFRQVDFGCYQPFVGPENRLFVIGCGLGTGADIWVLERPLGVLNDWSDQFAPPPIWATPAAVAGSPSEITMPQLVAGGDGRLHAFWSQTGDNGQSHSIDQTNSAIYYTRFNDGQWAPPRPILTSPVGKTNAPSVAADLAGNLFAVWNGGESGQIYFSRAVADRASSVSEWITPLSLLLPLEMGSWPDIIVDDTGTLYVAYAVPLNENRGIYLMKSTDGGDTWDTPVRVFDGAAADWEMVGAPHLALADDGHLHLTWTHDTLPTGIGVLALLYTHSEDDGQSWSEPKIATQQSVLWHELTAVDERSLHRAWLAVDDGRLALFHQYSIDHGLTWSTPSIVFMPDVVGGPAALITADDGPHLLQLGTSVVNDAPLLQEWLWDGARWRPEDSYSLEQEALETYGITAVAAPDGRFGIIYAALFLDETNQQLQNEMYYIERAWEAPEVAATPLPALTATPLPAPTDTPVLVSSPTPTRSFADAEEAGFSVGPLSVDDSTGSIVLSLIPAVLLIIVVFAIGIRMRRAG